MIVDQNEISEVLNRCIETVPILKTLGFRALECDAVVLQALGERDAALEHARRARGLRPDDPALSALVDELQAAR